PGRGDTLGGGRDRDRGCAAGTAPRAAADRMDADSRQLRREPLRDPATKVNSREPPPNAVRTIAIRGRCAPHLHLPFGTAEATGTRLSPNRLTAARDFGQSKLNATDSPLPRCANESQSGITEPG